MRKNKETNKTKQNKLFPVLCFHEDAIRHKIAQMTSKYCHMITWGRRQHRYGGR